MWKWVFEGKKRKSNLYDDSNFNPRLNFFFLLENLVYLLENETLLDKSHMSKYAPFLFDTEVYTENLGTRFLEFWQLCRYYLESYMTLELNVS